MNDDEYLKLFYFFIILLSEQGWRDDQSNFSEVCMLFSLMKNPTLVALGCKCVYRDYVLVLIS